MLDQVIRLIATLTVGTWIVRYLGPEQYGFLALSQAIVAVISSFASFGINTILVRELARTPEDRQILLETSFLLKTAGSSIGLLICTGIAWWQPFSSDQIRPLLLISMLGIMFQVFDVFELLFQAQGKARIGAQVRIAVCLIANSIKAVLIIQNASLLTFALIGSLEFLFNGIGWIVTAKYCGCTIKSLQINKTKISYLLKESWPVAAAGLAISAQAYGDQIILGIMMHESELGNYAAALRIINVFAFVPMVMQTVMAPEITEAKNKNEFTYYQRLYNLYRLMNWIFLLTFFCILFFGNFTINFLFGSSYASATTLLPWIALRLFFTNFGLARNLFIVNEALLKFGLLTSLVGAVSNLVLNIFLIPVYGMYGVIASFLISFAITTFGFDYFHAATRLNLRIMLKAICMPWRTFSQQKLIVN
jgi:O-antigen/teichoic acid export membrane protein